jgi:hypothetical protein
MEHRTLDFGTAYTDRSVTIDVFTFVNLNPHRRPDSSDGCNPSFADCIIVVWRIDLLYGPDVVKDRAPNRKLPWHGLSESHPVRFWDLGLGCCNVRHGLRPPSCWTKTHRDRKVQRNIGNTES